MLRSSFPDGKPRVPDEDPPAEQAGSFMEDLTHALGFFLPLELLAFPRGFARESGAVLVELLPVDGFIHLRPVLEQVIGRNKSASFCQGSFDLGLQ